MPLTQPSPSLTCRQAELSLKRRKELARRALTELVQMMSPAVDSEGDSQGRQSGSLAWRLARSETSLAQETTQASYVFTPTPQEVWCLCLFNPRK